MTQMSQTPLFENFKVWASINGITLSMVEKESIISGEELNDLVIDAVQYILKKTISTSIWAAVNFVIGGKTAFFWKHQQ